MKNWYGVFFIFATFFQVAMMAMDGSEERGTYMVKRMVSEGQVVEVIHLWGECSDDEFGLMAHSVAKRYEVLNQKPVIQLNKRRLSQLESRTIASLLEQWRIQKLTDYINARKRYVLKNHCKNIGGIPELDNGLQKLKKAQDLLTVLEDLYKIQTFDIGDIVRKFSVMQLEELEQLRNESFVVEKFENKEQELTYILDKVEQAKFFTKQIEDID